MQAHIQKSIEVTDSTKRELGLIDQLLWLVDLKAAMLPSSFDPAFGAKTIEVYSEFRKVACKIVCPATDGGKTCYVICTEGDKAIIQGLQEKAMFAYSELPDTLPSPAEMRDIKKNNESSSFEIIRYMARAIVISNKGCPDLTLERVRQLGKNKRKVEQLEGDLMRAEAEVYQTKKKIAELKSDILNETATLRQDLNKIDLN